METYDREHYTFKTYKDERYALHIETQGGGGYAGESVVYSDSYKELYERGKVEVKKGNRVMIWELKAEFIL